MRIPPLRLSAASRFLASAGLLSGLVAGVIAAPLHAGSGHDGHDAEETSTLFLRAKRVIVRPGHVLENAAVIVKGGRIEAVGTDLAAPDGAETVEGEVICAAFMDAWSTAGISADSVRGRDINAATLAADAVDPYGQRSILQELASAGVLLTRSQAGMTADFGGIGAVLRTSDAEVLLPDAAMSVLVTPPPPTRFVPRNFGGGGPGGFSFAPPSIDPLERIAKIDKLVSELESGQKYADDRATYEAELAEWEAEIAEKEEELQDDFKKAKKARDKKVKEAEEDGEELKEKKYKESKRPRAPRFDAEKAAFARAVTGEIPLVVHADRAMEIRDLLRATEPFKRVRLILAGGTSALACKDMLRERGVQVIVAPSPANAGGPVGELDPGLSLAGELHAAGIDVLIGTGTSSARTSRDLPLVAALAVGHGLDEEAALASITSGPAEAFDVADQVGMVKRGLMAELLVLSGDPLSSSSRVIAAVSGGSMIQPAGR
ncbi:MAG: amidohydrolase family protein [Planctomycetota bacterium]